MGQIFCALVLFIVIFSVDAWSTRRNSEQGDTLCSQNHPLYPYIKLFNVIPKEWKSENDDFKDKKPVCFTRTMTTETDDKGNEINKFSSYEITFGLPKKYEKLLDQQEDSDDGQEFVNYLPVDETTTKDDITTKNVVYIRCSKNNEKPNTSTTESEIFETRKSETTLAPEQTTVNDDLGFINDLDEICEEHLDVDIINTLRDDDATPEPDIGNTRKNGDVIIEYTTDKPETTTTEAETSSPTEFITLKPEDEEDPSILSRVDGNSFTEVTTEISKLISQILDEMSNPTETIIPTTIEQDYTVSFATLKSEELSPEPTIQTEITTQHPVEPVTEEVTDVSKKDEHQAFIIQMKNIVTPNSHADCYLINSKIKYGKCAKPIVPIRILTESKLPKNVKPEFEQNLESNRDFDELIVSGRNYCYLLKNLTSIECPANHDDMATILEIEDLPENANDDSYITIGLKGKCTTVSKYVDVIECPIYQDYLPHIRTEHLPDHVRLKHNPGLINVHIDDIIVHSYSHCLLLRATNNMECRGKPNIVLKEDKYPDRYKDGIPEDDILGDDILKDDTLKDDTLRDDTLRDHTLREDDISREDDILREDDIKATHIINDEDPLPTYRIGDYSLEKLGDLIPKSFELSQEFEEYKDPLTTPCNSEEDDKENSDLINRATRTLPYPTTESPESDRRLKNKCVENDVNCQMQKTDKEGIEVKSRRTLKPQPDDLKIIEITTPKSTIKPTTEITEIIIPNSKKLSKLLKTILDESQTEPMARSSDLFKPDFIVKIACAQQIKKISCFYVSKYIMQPTFDDPHDYNYLIDKSLFPVDAKIVSAPNLNIFEANETIYAISGKTKYVLIKKEMVDCPADPKDSFFVLDTGSCVAERRDELSQISIVKYQKGSKVYCFDFDHDMRLHQVKCPEDLSTIPVLSRPQDLKTLCRTQLKNKGHDEHMKLLKRLNIVTDY